MDERRENRSDRRNDVERSSRDVSSLNDISWYSRNPNLLAAAGAFPYPYRPGMKMNFSSNNKNGVGVFSSIESLMRLDWVPSFGVSSTSTDPASIAATEFYKRVREAFSGSIEADAPDFLVYIGALDSIFTYIGWLKRIYRAISTYTPENMDMPDAILRASGFTADVDIQNLRVNKVRLWQMINELILMTHKFQCPAVMDLFNRHYWMSDNVYADQASLRAQLYIYNLVGVYALTELPIVGDSGNNKAMGLQIQPLPVRRFTSAAVTVEDLYNYGLDLIQRMSAWDDGHLISGYLMRAFKDAPSFTIAELQQGELITAVYVPEVLSQIENFRTVYPPACNITDADLVAAMKQCTVSQNVIQNAIVTNASIDFNVSETDLGQFSSWAKLYNEGTKAFINVHSDLPTIADTVIASRMTAHTNWKAATSGNVITATYSCGTELPLGMAIYGMGINTSMFPINTWEYIDLSVAQTYNDNYIVACLFGMQQFDWHPIVMAVVNMYSGTCLQPAGDLYNPTVVGSDELTNLHKICLYSELNSFGI